MQYKVPQNVQREDTILGPITTRQLLILGVGGGIAYFFYVSLAKTYFMEVWLPPVAIISALTLAFAFLKIHNLPFHIFLICFLEYHLLPRKRIWIMGNDSPYESIFNTPKKSAEKKEESSETKKPQKSLKELTQILDTHGNIDRLEKKEKLNELIEQNYKNKN